MLNPTAQIFNDSVDAYASWTLFLSVISILVLISGVVLLTHKKPEPSTMQRDGGVALDAIPGRSIPPKNDGKIERHGEMHSGDAGRRGQGFFVVLNCGV